LRHTGEKDTAMEVTVTLAQAIAVRQTMSPQATVIYARTPDRPDIVDIMALLDPKVGQMLMRWATEEDKPRLTNFLNAFPGAVEVASITG
jgi:hypothetical protein